MAQLLPLIEEDEASPEIAEVYDRIKRDMQVPYVPNWAKVLAASPSAFKIYMSLFDAFYENISLPHSVVAMICYTVAKKTDCAYCSATNELTCRTLGVDEETLSAIVNDLSSVKPERIRGIIEFAVKVAKYPKTVAQNDYDELRALGISTEEIMEIILIAGIAVLNDTMADAVKLEVDSHVVSALAK
jgi:uncharacterized peroxidase-related enzyme